MNAPKEEELLTDLLKSVSRSFYLSLRTLPSSIRKPISIAYLLARASDTIADTDALPASRRLEALDEFEEAALEGDASLELGALSPLEGSDGESTLMRRIGEAIAVLETTDGFEREEIRRVLRTIISGQRLDIERFELRESDGLIALKDEAELDDYTYRVAGSVGEFWTRICGPELMGCAEGRELDARVRLGRRYGQGLQLINILRDIPEDYRRGRVYLPEDKLGERSLSLTDFGRPENWGLWRDYYETLVRRARAQLDDGWYYTSLIPNQFHRLRFATGLPALIGRDTLALLARSEPMSEGRIKVSKGRVYYRIASAFLGLWSPVLWRGLWNTK